MTELRLLYDCAHTPGDNITVDEDGFDDNTRVNLNIREGLTYASVVLSREDAVDLAWNILAFYGEAEKPAEPVKNGDYIVVQRASSVHCGLLGRVVEVRDTSGHVSLAITDLAGERHWVGGDDVKSITPAVFKTLANTRIAELMTAF